MGFRDLKGSIEQFNILPRDPEVEAQARIDRIITESIRLAGLEDPNLSVNLGESGEEWTLVYDKFQITRR